MEIRRLSGFYLLYSIQCDDVTFFLEGGYVVRARSRPRARPRLNRLGLWGGL